jgi:integrase/recombinase XerD
LLTHFPADTLCLDISQKTINMWILSLQEQKLADASINTIIRSNRVFFYWCMENDYMPKFKINLIKEDTPEKQVYTNEELLVLLKKPNTNDFSEYRNFCIINFLIGTGVRLSTLVHLNIGDIDFTNQTVILRHTKNRKVAVIPIGNTLVKILKDYIKIYLSTFDNDSPLFPNQYAKRFSDSGIGIQHALNYYNTNRGIKLKGVHAFRHAFAKNYIMNGGDIFTLQKLMQHQSLEMVRRYVNLFGADLRKGYDKYNPLERLTSLSRGTTIKPL